MPPCDAPHLIAYLFEIGPVAPGAMSGAPLSFLEIQAWQDCTGIALESWEARVLRRLSAEYLSESHAATKRDCKPPWIDADEVMAAPSRASESLRNSIRGLAQL